MARRPAEIRAAYAHLGLAPGAATLADARRVYRRLAMDCHPDHHQDDPTAATRFRELTDAYETVQEHIKAGGKLADLDEDERGSAPMRAGPRVTIYEVIAPAGAGKTTRWAEALARQPRGRWRRVRPGEVFPSGQSFRMDQTSGESEFFEPSVGEVIRRGGFQWPPGHPRHMIYAGPTIDLLNEVADALKKVGVAYTIIHSDPNSRGPLVNHKLARHFEGVKPDDDAVLLITHSALMNQPHRLLKRKKKVTDPDVVVFDRKEWDLVIDEAPEILTFFAENWHETQQIVNSRVDAIEWSDDLYRLIPSSDAAITRFRFLILSPDTNIGDGTREIAKALINPYRMVLVHRAQWDDLTSGVFPHQMLYGGAIDVMVIATPLAFSDYRSITVMGARLDTTMYHVLWRKLFKMEFRTHPLQDQLPKTHRNGKRLRLWYMVDEPATRDLLQRKAEAGGTMFAAMTQRVSDFFAPPKASGVKPPRNRQFIWSAPLDRGSVHGVKDTFFRELRGKPKTSSRPGTRPFDPDLRLSGRSAGQNRFLKYHNAVLFNVVNFSPNHYVMLHSVGLTDAEIYRALAHNVAYQDLNRGAIRVAGLRDIFNGIVIDRATALDIGGEFPGCSLHQLPDAPKRAERKRPGPPKKAGAMSPAERQRRYQAKMRAARQHAKERLQET